MNPSTTSPTPPSNARDTVLDGIRGLAILMVMVKHLWVKPTYSTSAIDGVLSAGFLGVDLFFVLSGFLITGILFRTKDKEGFYLTFLWRRGLRIYPLYYICFALLMICVYVFEGAGARFVGPDHWIWNATFTTNVPMAMENRFQYQSDVFTLGHFWSLCVEQQFYLFWPWVVYFCSKRSLIILSVLMMAVSPFLRLYLDQLSGADWSLASYAIPFARLDAFGAGALLSMLWKDYPATSGTKFRKYLWIAFLVVFATTSAFSYFRGGHEKNLLWSVTFMLLIWLAMGSQGPLRRFFGRGLLQHLGTYSFGLYVFHHLFRPGLWRYVEEPMFKSGMSPWLAEGVYFTFVFALAYILARLSWRFIEEPVSRLKG